MTATDQRFRHSNRKRRCEASRTPFSVFVFSEAASEYPVDRITPLSHIVASATCAPIATHMTSVAQAMAMTDIRGRDFLEESLIPCNHLLS